MMATNTKDPSAFLTIGELADQLGVQQHILRFWEQRFPQLRPLQRAGNRRYYRPDDVVLVRRIHRLLNAEGYTVKGVQKLLSGKESVASPPMIPPTSASVPNVLPLIAIRDRLARALTQDSA